MLDLPNLYPTAQNIILVSKGYSELGPELIEEALRLVDEGKMDTEISQILGIPPRLIREIRDRHGRNRSRGKKTEISTEVVEEALVLIDSGMMDREIGKILGISTYKLREIRDKHGRSRSKGNRTIYTIEQRNDVIDLIREGHTLSEVSSLSGVSRNRVKEWREEEIRDGNPLPEFLLRSIKSEQWRNGFSDEAIIELAILNPGFGIIRFSKELNISMAPLLQLFTQFKEHTGGDLYDYLNDVLLISEEDYINNYGQIPNRIRDRKKAYRDEGGVFTVLYPSPPMDFKWGIYQRDEFQSEEKSEEHPKRSDIENRVQTWVNLLINSRGYIQQQEHRGEFVDLFEFGPKDWTFNKWMKHCGLILDQLTGRWYREEDGWPPLRSSEEDD